MNGMDAYSKAGRLVLILGVLAWATGALWARGAEGDEKFIQSTDRSAEKFTPGTQRFLAGATLELRGEATIVGAEVKLKQIARWSDSDKAAFEPVADLIVSRVGAGTAFRAVTLKELKSTLSDAGVNLAVIKFAGASHCTITRSDVASDERSSLRDWVDAKLAEGASTQPVKVEPVASVKPRVAQLASLVQGESKPIEVKTLKEMLVADLADRLSLPVDAIQMRFNQTDEKILRLAEPLFHFNVDGQRIHNLGEVAWDVTILSEGAKPSSQKMLIRANARAWQEQLIARIPLAYHQEIRSTDLVERRTLVDQIMPDVLMTRDQVIGQTAGRELQAGTVLTARLIEATPMAKIGDLLSVTITQGNVKITTVARAMEAGAYGQTIRARREGDGATYDVTLTGPKAGKMTPVGAPPERATANVAE